MSNSAVVKFVFCFYTQLDCFDKSKQNINVSLSVKYFTNLKFLNIAVKNISSPFHKIRFISSKGVRF